MFNPAIDMVLAALQERKVITLIPTVNEVTIDIGDGERAKSLVLVVPQVAEKIQFFGKDGIDSFLLPFFARMAEIHNELSPEDRLVLGRLATALTEVPFVGGGIVNEVIKKMTASALIDIEYLDKVDKLCEAATEKEQSDRRRQSWFALALAVFTVSMASWGWSGYFGATQTSGQLVESSESVIPELIQE